MSCFLLPVSFCTDLEGLMAKFWWRQKQEERRIHWVSWDKMCEGKSKGGLGFKNLRNFNFALLAKQGWRLLQNESSMVYKLLKTRYFPKSSFLNSSLGNCPSYSWRGIWEAKTWLERGCRWRIGDGNKVSLWNDRWIPGRKSLSQELRIQANDSGEVVASVINESTGWWDVLKLRSLFNPNLVTDIMKIRVFPRGTNDKQIWGQDKSGHFSVKSCYNMIKSYNAPNVAESSSAKSQEKFWKALWKMPVPNKIKVFTWRVCKDRLPSKDNLVKKNVPIDPSYSFCQHPEEDLAHAILNCNQIHEMWRQLLPSLPACTTPVVPDLVSYFVETKDMNKLATFFCLAWGFWYRRNKWEFDRVMLSPKQVSNQALGLMQKFKFFSPKHYSHPEDFFSWKPPSDGILKLNTDGAMFPDLHRAGMGAILRDSSGKMMMAASIGEPEMENPEAVELMAIFRGLQLCSTMGISHIQVESDCLLVIQALQQNNMENSLLGNLFSEVQKQTMCFASCVFSHVYREGNGAAHKLARNALRVENIEMWWDMIPDFLSQALWFDKCL